MCEVGASEVETQGSMVGGLGLVAFEAHSVGLGKAILVGFEVVGVERMVGPGTNSEGCWGQTDSWG